MFRRPTTPAGLRSLLSLTSRQSFSARASTWTKVRSFGTASSPNDNDDVYKKRISSSLTDLVFDTSCTVLGRDIFFRSGLSGIFLFYGLALGDPFLACLAALGSTTSTMTAHYCQLDRTCWFQGLYSFNGCLVGCATATYLAPDMSIGVFTSLTMVGASTSTLVTQILSNSPTRMPPWTIAFNLVTLTALLRLQPLPVTTAASNSSSIGDAAETVTTALVEGGPYWYTLYESTIVGLAQIFVVESPWTGLCVMVALGIYSPVLAVHAFTGSLTGAWMGSMVYGVPSQELVTGLWGFNSALTSMGVGVCFRPTKQSLALSVGGAAAAASVYAALQPVFGLAGSPCLTLPFCITMSGCYLLGTATSSSSKPLIPGLWLATQPHSPETNFEEKIPKV